MYFRWNKASRKWDPRAKYKMRGSDNEKYDFSEALEQFLRRIPSEGDRYVLKLLLFKKLEQYRFLLCVGRMVFNTPYFMKYGALRACLEMILNG